MKEKAYVLKGCACRVTDSRYVKMCDKHQAETDAIHKRWAAERLAQTPVAHNPIPHDIVDPLAE